MGGRDQIPGRDNRRHSDSVGRLLQKALAMRAADPSIYNDIGIEYRKLRDYQAAIPLWHRAIAAGEDSTETYSHLANAYNLSKNPSEGLRWLRRVLERYPDSSQARQVREMMRTQEERL